MHPLISVAFPLLVISLFLFSVSLCEIPYGLAVRFPGFYPGGPGSTPGIGIHFLSVSCFYQSPRLVKSVESIKVKSSFSTTVLRLKTPYRVTVPPQKKI